MFEEEKKSLKNLKFESKTIILWRYMRKREIWKCLNWIIISTTFETCKWEMWYWWSWSPSYKAEASIFHCIIKGTL